MIPSSLQQTNSLLFLSFLSFLALFPFLSLLALISVSEIASNKNVPEEVQD